MLSVLSGIFQPFVYLIERGFSLYLSATGSPGVAILLTSATFSLAIFPLQRWSRRFETRVNDRHEMVQAEVARLDRSLRGESRFNEIEKIYRRHGYHPIQSIALGISFFISVPFLIASVLLFHESTIVAGQGFLFIDDLANPDHSLRFGGHHANLLPLFLFVFTFFDAWLRYKDNRTVRRRFIVISCLLTLLVYQMPASLLIYWIGANAMSFLVYQASTLKQGR